MKKGIALVFAVLVGLMWFSCAWAKGDQVVIKRDSYGVSHVYAESVYGIFLGYGYSIARDRLFQIDMVRYTGQGRVAEVLGSEYVDFDKKVRANYQPGSVRNQLANLPPDERDIFEGYAAGINVWLDKIKKNPELLPKQYKDFDFNPEPWDSFDIAMVFVGTMLNRFGDFNTEPSNLQILMGLKEKHGPEKAMAIFDQLIPREVSGAPTTIQKEDWPHHQSSFQDFNNHNWDLASLSLPDWNEPGDIHKEHAFSNVIILGKDKAEGADAILMNGPQFGNYVPGYVYSIGLHGAGFDLVGNTPYGYPVILFGYNRDITWGSTWGAGDIIDVYQLSLNPENPLQYQYNGAWKEMDKRTETILVKGGDPVSTDIFWTVHGAVIHMDPEKNMALSKRRSWDGLELDTLIGWINTTRAKNWEEWIDQASRSALNVNMYYADKDGNIGYAFTGKYPDRKEGHDNRLPVPGDGSMDWKGFLSFDHNPKVYNPKQGYIINWNNRPAYGGVLNPDMFWYSWSKADRMEVLVDYIEARPKLEPEELWNVIEHSSFYDVNARYFLPFIAKAGTIATDDAVKNAAQAIQEWDLHSRDDNQDGKYDELGTAIFRTFLSHMIKETLADDLDKAFPFFANPGYPTPEKPMTSGLNIQIGTKAIVESLLAPADQEYDFFNGEDPESVALRALAAAVSELQKTYGTDMADWRIPSAPMAFVAENFMQIPQASIEEATKLTPGMNRGTENNMTIFKDGKPVGWEVTPPGQSGFVAADGTADKHYMDQMDMYAGFGKKRTYLFLEDVDANKAEEVVLTISK
jgi:penicillin G amidase